jgi:hypothetical protein
MGWKKNAFPVHYLNKAILLINTQLDFVKGQIQIEKQGQCTLLVSQQNSYQKVKWTGTIIQLVELIYALYEAGCFKDVPLKELFTVMGATFSCEIKNHYRLFWDIKNRKIGDRTKFLDDLKTALTIKLCRMDGRERK